MNEDVELLGRYAAERSEVAFAELTRRHVDLVYSAALRLMRGDIASAQDVTQQVFVEMAGQAERLARHPALVGWLYTTTRLVALRATRTEQRRRAREREACTMNELVQDDLPPADWDRIGHVIEAAMHELADKDRNAVLLRFFQNKSLGEVGRALNLTENAARMRVERALERLRGKLARRGITTTAAALAAVVSANAVQAAPAGLVTSLSAALAGSGIAASTLLATTQALAMTTLQKAIVAAALTAAVGTGLYAVHHSSQLTAEIRALQQDQAPLTAKLQRLEQEGRQASNQLAALREENARLKSGQKETELLKLRGEVGTLRRRAVSSQTQPSPPSSGMAKMMSDPVMKEYIRRALKEKMRSLYGDLIQELKLTPEQTEQFLELLTAHGAKNVARLTEAAQGSLSQADAEPPQDMAAQLRAVLGDAGCGRFKEYSDEIPGRATLNLLNAQLGSAALTEQQSANLIRVIKSEPADLTQGIIGSPDKAFMGSQADIDDFLEQVAQSNQRVLQQAGGFLASNQLAALDSVLSKGVEARKIQGAAFFQKH